MDCFLGFAKWRKDRKYWLDITRKIISIYSLIEKAILSFIIWFWFAYLHHFYWWCMGTTGEGIALRLYHYLSTYGHWKIVLKILVIDYLFYTGSLITPYFPDHKSKYCLLIFLKSPLIWGNNRKILSLGKTWFN